MQSTPSNASEGLYYPCHGRQLKTTGLIALGLCLFLLPAIPSSQAEFTLNFIPDEKNNNGLAGTNVAYSGSADARISCYMSYLTSSNCGNNITGSHDDPGGFFQDMFRDTTTGLWYHHVIIGDYYAGDNFALEYIMLADASSYSGGGFGGGGSGSFNTNYRSSSAYNGTTTANTANQLYNMAKPYDVAGSDSLKTGTGTGNPTRVLMHQFLRDTDVAMVFLKDTFANKPLISQVTKNGNTKNFGVTGPAGVAADMTSTVILDARALNHSSTNAIATVATDTVINFASATGIAAGSIRHTNVTKKAGAGITNTVVLGGALTNSTTGDYNYATDNQNSNPTAGRYTYTAGTSYGQSNGTYTYVDAANGDSFQPSSINYADFCDTLQNPNWSGLGACKNRDGTGGGGGGAGGGGMGW